MPRTVRKQEIVITEAPEYTDAGDACILRSQHIDIGISDVDRIVPAGAEHPHRGDQRSGCRLQRNAVLLPDRSGDTAAEKVRVF